MAVMTALQVALSVLNMRAAAGCIPRPVVDVIYMARYNLNPVAACYLLFLPPFLSLVRPFFPDMATTSYISMGIVLKRPNAR